MKKNLGKQKQTRKSSETTSAEDRKTTRIIKTMEYSTFNKLPVRSWLDKSISNAIIKSAQRTLQEKPIIYGDLLTLLKSETEINRRKNICIDLIDIMIHEYHMHYKKITALLPIYLFNTIEGIPFEFDTNKMFGKPKSIVKNNK